MVAIKRFKTPNADVLFQAIDQHLQQRGLEAVSKHKHPLIAEYIDSFIDEFGFPNLVTEIAQGSLENEFDEKNS